MARVPRGGDDGDDGDEDLLTTTSIAIQPPAMHRIAHCRAQGWAALAPSAAAPAPASTSHHAIRRFTASRRSDADEGEQRGDAGKPNQAPSSDAAKSDPTSPSPPSPSPTPSLFDQIFSGPDPFPKAESPASLPRGRLLRQDDGDDGGTGIDAYPPRPSSSRNDPLPRGVLFDDPLDDRARPPPPRHGARQQRNPRRSQIDRTPLTTSEAHAFHSIFDTIWAGDRSRDGERLYDPLGGDNDAKGKRGGERDPSGLSSSGPSSQDRTRPMTSGGWLELHSYASRNLGARAALRDEHFASRRKGLSPSSSSPPTTTMTGEGATPYNPRIAAIRAHNEAAAAGYSDRDIEEGIDRARVEMAECQTVEQLWQWAAREVWGAGNQEAAKEPSTAAAPKYGLSTPFYAPVLHALFLALRDRFHSPSSALQVLRVVRAVGPSSLVLGTTALLYTEAVRTRWGHLADLRGARDLLAEAREIGLLAGGGGGGGGSASSGATTSTTTENWSASGEREEKSLRIVVDHVRSEVRTNVLGNGTGVGARREEGTEVERYGGAGTVSRLKVPQDEASRQAMAIVDEMGKLAGYPRRRSASSSSSSSSTFSSSPSSFGGRGRGMTERRGQGQPRRSAFAP